MRILLVSQYFWPENFIINDVVRNLVEQGHEVVVATGKPNYPGGDVYAGYSAKGIQRERYLDLVEVVRIPLHMRGKGGALNLILNYGSFVLFGLWHFPRLLCGLRFDAILVFAISPITQVIPAIFLKWLKHAHLAVWVQDLWPESLAATGFIRNRWALVLAGWMVRAIYACCDTLLLQSRAFFEPVACYANSEKLVYYPNSIDSRLGSGVVDPLSDELCLELDQHFSVVFAGNIGRAQAVETLIGAAVLLRDEPKLRLVMVGSGSMLDWVRERKREFGLDRLLLPGRFPMEAMPKIFECASALLVSLKDEEIFAYTIPSKIQAYLAAGKPIIASLKGEGSRVLLEAGAGVVCEPESSEALATSIKRLMALPLAEREEMGRAGRTYFNEHFDMGRQVTRMVEIIESRSGKKEDI